MLLTRLRYASDWLQGTFSQTRLDQAVQVDAYNHPSVVAALTATAANQTGSVLLTATGVTTSTTAGGSVPAWQSAAPYTFTTQAGDRLTLPVTTATEQVTLHLTGILASDDGAISDTTGLVSDMIDHGAIAQVLVDGESRAYVDLYGRDQDVPLYFSDGLAHTVSVVNTGTSNAPAGTAGTPTVGILGLSAYAAGAGMGAASYQSAVIDQGAGNESLQPFLLEWDGTALSSVTISVGNTPTLDASWVTLTVPQARLPLALLPFSGVTRGSAGLLGASIQATLAAALAAGSAGVLASTATAPIGRYVQFTLAFASISTITPSLRNVRYYAWDPLTDELCGSLPALEGGAAFDGILGTLAGTIAAMATDAETLAREYVGGVTIAGAADAYLAVYGVDSGQPQITAEPPEAYRVRLSAARQARALTGGSLPNLCQLAAQLVQGVSTGLITTGNGGALTVAACQGVTVRQLPLTLSPSQQYRVTIPAPAALYGGTYYPGLPGLPVPQAQAIITAFLLAQNPLGSVLDPHNAGNSNIQFLGNPVYTGN